MTQPTGPEEPLDLDSIDRVLATTRSVRRRLDFERPVEPQTLLDCINLATQAPMGLGGEHWRFVIVTEPSRKQRLAALYREMILELEAARGLTIKATQRALMERLADMPALVFVYGRGEPPQQALEAQIGYFGSILPTAWSFMLALRARGIGTTWTSLLAARQSQVADVLEISEPAVELVMFPVAYTKDAVLKPARRADARSITYWNRWGNDSLP